MFVKHFARSMSKTTGINSYRHLCVSTDNINCSFSGNNSTALLGFAVILAKKLAPFMHKQTVNLDA